jgi:predicted PurR-regulated permease PerM
MATTPEERYVRWRTTAVIVWAAIGILVLAAAVLWGIGRISAALVPFVMAFVLVFLLNVPVRGLVARGMKRGVATFVCMVITFGIIGGLLTLLGPTISRQLSSFGQTAPKYLAQVISAESAVETQFSALVLPEWFATALRTGSAQLGQFAVSLGDNLARILLNAGGRIATGLLDIFLAVVIAFWVLTDLPKMREEIAALAGPTYEADAEHLLATVTHVVGGYLRGQTIASLTTATISTIGLMLFHVPYALVLGLIAFLFNFAPYIGPVTTGLIAALLGMFVGPWTAVAAVCCVIVAQNVTDFVVAPRVMSSQVDLHPTLVIFSLLVGGTLFGVPGLLFAIPTAATGKGLFVYYYERRTERQLSSTDGALFRHSGSRSTSAQTPACEPQAAEPEVTENAE